MRTLLQIGAAISFVTLAGCAAVGNEKIKDQTQASISQAIKEGVTTKAEVQAALGSASAVSFTDAGNEIWTYRHSRATPTAQSFIPIVNLFSAGSDVKTKELIVMFDKNNVVSRYTMRDVDESFKSGIAQ